MRSDRQTQAHKMALLLQPHGVHRHARARARIFNQLQLLTTNLGIVADRPRIKMLAARQQYADHVVTLVPDIFLAEAWTVVPDMAGDQTG